MYVFIGVPQNYLAKQAFKHPYPAHLKTSEEVMSYIVGRPCHFITYIFTSDVYLISFDDENDMMMFMLRCEFPLFDEKMVGSFLTLS